jgi:hypothetical protein
MMGGRRVALHVDHVVPVCDGGTNDDRNLVPACRVCNLHKGDRRLEETSLDIRFLPDGFAVEVGNDGRVTGVTHQRYQRRGEEKREEVPPPPREAAQTEDGWHRLRTAWNAGPGRPWKHPQPPDGLEGRLAEPGWLDEAVQAIAHLPKCRYFKTPPTLVQLCGSGFVRRVLGGQYDDARPERGAAGEQPKRQLDPEFSAAVRRTEAALAAKRREAS